MNDSRTNAHFLYTLLEMLEYHNSLLSIEDSDKVRQEIMTDNLVVIKVIKNILAQDSERSIN